MHTAGTTKLSSPGESSIEVCGLICHLFRLIFKHLPRICTCYGTSYCMYILCDLNILPRPSLFFGHDGMSCAKGEREGHSLPAESADALGGLVVYCTHIGRMGREGGGYGTSNVEGR